MTSRGDDFEELIGKYSRVMSRAIRGVCGKRRRALIPDVEQEVRLALWKRLGSGKKIEHPVSYLYKMALTTALAVLRKHGSDESHADVEALDASSRARGGSRELLPPERARLLEQLVGRLPVDQSRALRAYLAGFNHKEVAVLFGWSESIARHRIYRGMAALKDETQGSGEA